MATKALSEVVELKKALSKAQEANDKQLIDSVLKKMLRVTVTKEMLKTTGAGQVVGKLRQHEDAEISKLAKAVVAKWKKDVTSEGKAVPASASGATTPTTGRSVSLSEKSSADSSIMQKPATPTVSENGSAVTDTATTAAAVTASRPANGQLMNRSGASTPANKPTVERSVVTDKVSFTSIGDNIRQKCCEMLYNSLAIGSTADSEKISSCARAIESIEFTKVGSAVTPAYKSRIRTLCLSLRNKDNPGLRAAIVDGRVMPERFCNMSPEEMASEERKRLDAQIHKDNLFKSRGAENPAAETDQFRCSKCGGRKCTYYQMQTRSADEPMTTFVTCTICNNRWKFC